MRTKISQREAHSLKKRVEKLEKEQRTRLQRWGSEYPGGVNIFRVRLDAVQAARTDVAIALEHTIVGKLHGEELLIYAVKP